ncbi:MAG TPA: endonuclease domain-containing protein [Candidatus Wujingus californicus]|uniref:endonuclease domain-containing protein n=1 Tax=Candidatus Wujingus californicus TaxID=3367618 RepID=UPI00402545CF
MHAERLLWKYLSSKKMEGLKFRRQQPIGKYIVDTFDGAKPRFLNRGKKRRSVSTLSIPRASDRGVEWVDFVCFEKRILIEVDGGQHARELNKNIKRDECLRKQGIKVLE